MRKRIITVQIGDAPRKQWVWLESKPTHKNNFADWTTYSPDSNGKKPINGGPVYWPKDRYRAKYAFGAELLPKLSPGTHKLTFRVEAECYGRTDDGYKTVRHEVAKTDIQLKVTARSVKRHWRKKGPKLPRSPYRKNRRLRKKMMRTVAAKWKNEKVLGAVTLSRRWNIVRHRYIRRRVLRRVIQGAVVVKKKGAKTCRVFSLSFSQKSRNGRRSFHPQMTIGVGRHGDFPCANAR